MAGFAGEEVAEAKAANEMKQETFENVTLPEGWYEVLGNPGYYVNGRENRARGPKGELATVPGSSTSDYIAFGLSPGWMTIHVAQKEAIDGKTPEGMEVHHINSNPKDNRPENLRFVTRRENLLEQERSVRARERRARQRKTITEAETLEIMEFLAEGEMTHKEIAELYPISRSTVSSIANGSIGVNRSALYNTAESAAEVKRRREARAEHGRKAVIVSRKARLVKKRRAIKLCDQGCMDSMYEHLLKVGMFEELEKQGDLFD